MLVILKEKMIDPVTLAVINGRFGANQRLAVAGAGPTGQPRMDLPVCLCGQAPWRRPPYPPALPEAAQETLRE